MGNLKTNKHYIYIYTYKLHKIYQFINLTQGST